MVYDYSKLKGKITEKYGNQKNFASVMGLSERSVSLKLDNKVCWKQHEMARACEVLNIPYSKIQVYFFAKVVQ